MESHIMSFLGINFFTEILWNSSRLLHESITNSFLSPNSIKRSYNLFNYPPSEGHLSFFRFVDIMNEATRSIHAQSIFPRDKS